MAGVDAHAHAGLVVHARDDVAQVLEPPADDVAVAAHVLEDRDGGLGRPVGAVELGGDAPARRGHRLAARRARVEVVEPYAERIAPLQVVYEVVVGLVRLGLVGLCEVDEVGTVREDVLALVVLLLLGCGVEGVAVFVLEFWVGPFTLRLEEEGKGIGADVRGILDGVLAAFGEGTNISRSEWKMGIGLKELLLTSCATDMRTDVHCSLEGADGCPPGERHRLCLFLLLGLPLLGPGLLFLVLFCLVMAVAFVVLVLGVVGCLALLASGLLLWRGSLSFSLGDLRLRLGCCTVDFLKDFFLDFDGCSACLLPWRRPWRHCGFNRGSNDDVLEESVLYRHSFIWEG